MYVCVSICVQFVLFDLMSNSDCTRCFKKSFTTSSKEILPSVPRGPPPPHPVDLQFTCGKRNGVFFAPYQVTQLPMCFWYYSVTAYGELRSKSTKVNVVWVSGLYSKCYCVVSVTIMFTILLQSCVNLFLKQPEYCHFRIQSSCYLNFVILSLGFSHTN
jgi:hypothetical protein